jgi:hypothetical protein
MYGSLKSINFAKEVDMLSRLSKMLSCFVLMLLSLKDWVKDWYVFEFFERVDDRKSFKLLIAVYVVAIILDNFIQKSMGFDIGGLIWGASVFLTVLLAINFCLNHYLRDKIMFAGKISILDYKSYFIAFEKESGKELARKEGEYCFDGFKTDHLPFNLIVPQITDKDEVLPGGVVRKAVAFYDVPCKWSNLPIGFTIFVTLCEQYDLEELIKLASDVYLEDGIPRGYEECLKKILMILSPKLMRRAERAMEEAQKEAGEKIDQELVFDEDDLANAVVGVYLQLVKEEFKPIFLSNVVNVEIELDLDYVYERQDEQGDPIKISLSTNLEK